MAASNSTWSTKVQEMLFKIQLETLYPSQYDELKQFLFTFLIRYNKIMKMLTAILYFTASCTIMGYISHTRASRNNNVTSMSSSNSQAKTPKKPFQLFRFVKTLSFYDVLTPGFLKKKGSTVRSYRPNDLIWSKSEDNGFQWGPLDDVVMGGVSKTDLEAGKKFDGIWKGFF